MKRFAQTISTWAVVCLLATIGTVTYFAETAWAQSMGNGLMPANVARRYGLERTWHTQVEVGRARGRVRHVTLHVNSSRNMTIVEVFQGPSRWVFTEHDRDAFQQPLGPDGAQKKAQEHIAKLKKHQPDAGEPRLEIQVVPEVTLYAVTDQAIVHAIDGETGKTRWVTKIGNAAYPTTAAAANDKFVTALNGSFLFCLDARTGDVKWQRQTQGVPGAGPAVSADHVFAPMTNGRIESYTLEDFKADPWIYSSLGRAMIQPTVGFDALTWPTDRGHLYVASASARAIRYRLEAKETIVASPVVASADRVIAPSADGYLYCVHPGRQNGNIHWKFSTGETLSQSPIVVGETAYVISDYDTLYAVGVKDGMLRWRTSNMKKLLTVSDDRIYVVGEVGRLAILNRETGSRIAVIPLDEFDLQIPNPLTDRIYYGTKQGTIQCLREIGHRWPTVHAASATAAKPKPSAKPAAKPGEAPEDPFGAPAAKPAADANDDPFAAPGGAAKPAADDEDPFGAPAPAAKPGSKPAADDTDPFGG